MNLWLVLVAWWRGWRAGEIDSHNCQELVTMKEKPCTECGARKPIKNGHHWGCKKGKK